MNSKIKNIIAREIIDSRGNPTVEADIILENGIKARAAVPSGASTGEREAIELRDGDIKRFNGKGVLKAVNNINTIIKENLLGMDVLDQRAIDNKMIELDGTLNKANLGANAILAVSMAALKAAALFNNKEVYEYIGTGKTLPLTMMNILNGGMHADNGLEFQEYMIIPNASSIRERIQIGCEVFHSLHKVLKTRNLNTGVGDEGGFAPKLNSNKEALDLIIEAIILAGYQPAVDVNIGLDVAASSFYKDGKYILNSEKRELSSFEFVNYLVELATLYPIISIEDPVDENDWDGFKLITSLIGNRVQIVGDDLFVTNKVYLQKGIDLHAGNAILIKVNQIGTISETIDTINLAKQNNYKTIISHRSGETEDTTIAHLAVGLNIGQIKTGSLSRTDRICKYNELMRIDEYIKTRG